MSVESQGKKRILEFDLCSKSGLTLYMLGTKHYEFSLKKGFRRTKADGRAVVTRLPGGIVKLEQLMEPRYFKRDKLGRLFPVDAPEGDDEDE